MASGNKIYSSSRNSDITQVCYWFPSRYVSPFSFQISQLGKELYTATSECFFVTINGDGIRQSLKGVEAHSKVLSIKAMHGRILGDFMKPSLISVDDVM